MENMVIDRSSVEEFYPDISDVELELDSPPQVIRDDLENRPKEIRDRMLTSEEQLALKRVRKPCALDDEERYYRTFTDPELHTFLSRVAKKGLLTAREEVVLSRLVQKGLAAEKRLENGISAEMDFADEDEVIAGIGQEAFGVMRDCNILLTVKLAKAFSRKYKKIPVMDFIQEGIRGIERAIEKFDPEKGYKFSTYATHWIRNFMQRHGQKTNSTIKMPIRHYTDGSLDKYIRLRKAGKDQQEAAEILEVSGEKHSQLEAAYTRLGISSLDAETQTKDGNSNPRYEFIEDLKSTEAFEAIFDDDSDTKQELGPVYDTLVCIFGVLAVRAFMKFTNGEALGDTNAARVAKMKTMLQHPAVQSAINQARGVENPWNSARCAEDLEKAKKVTQSREKNIKEMCTGCPLLDQCEALVDQVKPKQGQWAGIMRAKKSYYPNGDLATVLGVARSK